MARPKKDSPAEAAPAKMQEAFWHVLEQKPYAKITVSDITAEAQVNRNSFYYHYEYMDEFARACIGDALPREIVRAFISSQGSSPQDVAPLFAKFDARLRRIRLACSSRGGVLASFVRKEILTIWMQEFGVDEDKLNGNERIMVAFATGGIVTVLGESSDEALGVEGLRRYIGSPFAQSVIASICSTLNEAAKR